MVQTEVSSTDVAEGRYIKGDPLKGYYDFIITEGSYKFWAGFQVNSPLFYHKKKYFQSTNFVFRYFCVMVHFIFYDKLT